MQVQDIPTVDVVGARTLLHKDTRKHLGAFFVEEPLCFNFGNESVDLKHVADTALDRCKEDVERQVATVQNCLSSIEACEKGFKKGESCLRREISFAAPLGGKEDILRHCFQGRPKTRGNHPQNTPRQTDSPVGWHLASSTAGILTFMACSRQHRQVCAQGPGSDRHQRVHQVTIFPALSFQCCVGSKQSAVSPRRVELHSNLLEDGCWLLVTEVCKATPPGLLMSCRRCATAALAPAPPWKRHPGQPP